MQKDEIVLPAGIVYWFGAGLTRLDSKLYCRVVAMRIQASENMVCAGMTFLKENPGLLELYRKGDCRAFEEIYHFYVNSVTRLIASGFSLSLDPPVSIPGIVDSQVQCDLVQETFVRAFSETARRKYDGVRPFRYYLLRITKNLVIDFFRKRKLGIHQSFLDHGEELDKADFNMVNGCIQPVPACNPGELAHRVRQQNATKDFIDRLVGEQKLFYAYRYQKGLTQLKVAAGMGITRRRVRTLEKRLRDGLLEYLKEKKLWP